MVATGDGELVFNSGERQRSAARYVTVDIGLLCTDFVCSELSVHWIRNVYFEKISVQSRLVLGYISME